MTREHERLASQDHDRLLKIERDVSWIRESVEQGGMRFLSAEQRISSLEQHRSRLRGAMAAVAAVAGLLGLDAVSRWFSN